VEPLRGSKILKRIDLSLVGEHDDPRVYSKLKVKEVVPILKSIVINKSIGACQQLRHVQLPFQWRQEKKDELTYFMLAYNGLLHLSPSRMCCNHAEIECTENSSTSLPVQGREYGIQTNKCYKCLDEFCSDCAQDEDGWELGCFKCGCCEKVVCSRCSGPEDYHYWCQFCGQLICGPCVNMGKAMVCDDCEDVESCIRCEGVSYSEKFDCDLCAECLEIRER